MKPTAATIKMALKLADSVARSDVECCCASVGEQMPPRWDLNSVDAIARDGVAESMRYLELRGLVKRDPKNPQVVHFPAAGK